MVTVPEKCLVKKLLNVYVTGRAVSGRNEKDSRIFQAIYLKLKSISNTATIK